MPASRGIDVHFDADELRGLVRDLKQLSNGRALVAQLRRNLKKTAEPIKRQVQANASWSSRIPGAVSVGTSFAARRTGVFLRVNSKKAPHARPYENNGKPGSFRHRVFGQDVWVSEPARPFFFGHTARQFGTVERSAGEAVEEAARKAGFR